MRCGECKWFAPRADGEDTGKCAARADVRAASPFADASDCAYRLEATHAACNESVRSKFDQYESGLRDLRAECDSLRKQRDEARVERDELREQLRMMKLRVEEAVKL